MQMRDVDELLQVASEVGYDADYVQTEPGNIDITWTDISLPETLIAREQINIGVEYFGSGPSNTCSFIFVADGKHFFANGEDPGATRLYLAPPGADIHCVTGGAVDVYTITIPEHTFAQHVVRDIQLARLVAAGQLVPLPLANHAAAELAACLSATLQTDLPASLLHQIDHLILETLLSILHCADLSLARLKYDRIHKRKAFKRARDFILENRSERIVSAELADYAGMSERSLERLFLREAGVSPRQYIKTYRLNSAFRDLKSVHPAARRIHVVAMENGFFHLGRFSGEFQSHFGLLPSDLVG